ncbi:SDR family oxidoreductase [Nocardioides sp. GXZ039]|uniref:SDR family oxidoreductase n=1 Tax=Nocardioides sp. GXZ039 TaxID=3136018 RepID=UPI0030F4905C
MSRLGGRTILVVGGGSGIGRAAALAYLDAGARVTVVEHSSELAATLRADTSGRLEIVEGDGAEPDVLAAAVAAARGATGLDHLTCCVGVFDGYASIRELDADRLLATAERAWRLNVLSALLAAHAAWPALREARGSLTLTLSESAFRPAGGGVLYGSAKWALRGVVDHLAADLAPDVRVNGVAPGGTTATRFAGDGVDRDERIAAATLLCTTPTPADHAAAYLHLADPATSRVVTGQVLLTNGGSR